jgi:hypothetical protein
MTSQAGDDPKAVLAAKQRGVKLGGDRGVPLTAMARAVWEGGRTGAGAQSGN